MQIFTSLDLQRQTGDVQRAASQGGVVITSHGKPRNVMLSVEEFCRLKRVAQESVPTHLLARKSPVIRHSADPLGYDVRDFRHASVQMSRDAIEGVHAEAVDAELDRVRAVFLRGQR
ncbi:type II toxin-antitoxin system prevent-host-death family antitoxin [Rhizobium wuzhouense]|uniref:Antitoxin n=1 Tax=Rhizobium wuzhouense TaxID=1986026 RepID=A0ABX5NX49_9HYPH|nr:type II toxin-antitoxin system prevent-host-death family antitoxin [Rhizobium wuzhouense]PYB76932.1 type II toxin-antitoxin system Phd/YefM family antitoxin [Rhizobium wuzhouense]